MCGVYGRGKKEGEADRQDEVGLPTGSYLLLQCGDIYQSQYGNGLSKEDLTIAARLVKEALDVLDLVCALYEAGRGTSRCLASHLVMRPLDVI